jgi:two-component system sensor histidine kinase MtrB
MASALLMVTAAVALTDGTAAALLAGAVGAGAYLVIAGIPHDAQSASQWLAVAGTVGALALVCGRHRDRERRLRAEAAGLQAELTATARSSRDVLNMAAHELRTPLTVASGYLSMLQDEDFGELSAGSRRAINVVAGKTRELSTLVNTLLRAARLESGRMGSAEMNIDLRDAVRDAVERAEPQANLQEASVTMELPGQPVMAKVDPDNVAHILDNLVTNALTYADGRPRVKLTVSRESEPTVRVEDHGWGIAAEDAERIFDRHVRLDTPERLHPAGTGLGLWMSRELATQEGADLRLETSTVGEGSTFLLRFAERGAVRVLNPRDEGQELDLGGSSRKGLAGSGRSSGSAAAH